MTNVSIFQVGDHHENSLAMYIVATDLITGRIVQIIYKKIMCTDIAYAYVMVMIPTSPSEDTTNRSVLQAVKNPRKVTCERVLQVKQVSEAAVMDKQVVGQVIAYSFQHLLNLLRKKS